MTVVDLIGAALGAIILAAVFVLGIRRPVAALVVLLAALPVHSLVIVLLREWIGQPVGVTIAGLWKEALVAGLALPALPGLISDLRDGLDRLRAADRTRGALRGWLVDLWRDPRFEVSTWLIVALLVFVSLEVPASIVRGNPTSAVIIDWRGLAVPFLAWLAIRRRAITIDLALPAVRTVVAAGGLVAAYAYVQVFVLGFRFLNTFYREPGDPLATAYKVGVSAIKVPRAIGGHVAPNEFGLFLVTVIFGYLVILLGRPASTWTRRLQIAAGYAMLIALVITYSRSAWVGAITALIVLIVDGARQASTWRSALRRRSREVLAWSVATIAILIGVAYASGAFEVAQATVGGQDPSAGGRVTSISRGVGAAIKNPLGLGLGSAGPRAYAVDPHAIRTESWYLVTGIELGWVGGGIFGLTLLSLTRDVIRGWRRRIPGAAAATAAWGGALVGAFVIPALFDLPASLPIFVLMGLAASTIAARAGGGLRSPRSSGVGGAPEPG